MMKPAMKSKFAVMFSLALALCMLFNAASACTTIYVGRDLSADGSVIFGRSEDYSNSQNKLMYVAPAGKHAAGEVYNGCYGFTWTFTHDSYGYTAFSDDNGDGVGGICPDCDGDHAHTPYEAAGTNDKGVTITATETIGSADAVAEVDPYEDLGIEEAEIVTVVLSEAATAKEALDVLLGIYDTAGANAGSGIVIADSSETWYVENVTGHQYIAVKLTDGMALVQPNMSIIGAVDLDDADNVIASAGLIEVAQKAGSFVGDADANVINYVLSYNEGTAANARMVNALAFLDPAYADAEAGIDPAAYLISNVGENGEIVPVYTGIHPANKLTIEDVQDFYHIGNIGYVRNLETHVFQISGEGATGIIEWVAMDDASVNVFVPYYPMLTTDVDASYKLSTATAEFVEEEPAEGLYYATSVNRRVNGERVSVDGFMILPENWADSMYWSFDALSNLIKSGAATEEQAAAVYDALSAKQAEVNEAFAALTAQLAEAADPAQLATDWSMKNAQAVHELAVTLTNGLIAE